MSAPSFSEMESGEISAGNQVEPANQLQEENIRLIHKITQLQQMKFKQAEKIKYLEETNSLLVDDLENKSKLLQQKFIYSKTEGRRTKEMEVHQIKKHSTNDKSVSNQVVKKLEIKVRQS